MSAIPVLIINMIIHLSKSLSTYYNIPKISNNPPFILAWLYVLADLDNYIDTTLVFV